MRKRLFCIFVCSFLLLAACLGVAAAPSAGADLLGEQDYIEWTLSEDRTTITGNGRSYTYYTSRHLGSMVILPESYYRYANELDFLPPGKEGAYASVQIESARRDAEIIWLSYEGVFFIYVTESGRTHLDFFFNSKAASEYRLIDDNYNQVEMDGDLMASLNALYQWSQAPTKNYKSTALEGKPQYRVGKMDDHEDFFLACGMIFSLADGYYYLSLVEEELTYSRLYDSEQIYTLYKLDDADAERIGLLRDNLERVRVPVIYEDGIEYEEDLNRFEDDEEGEGAAALLLVLLVLFGLVTPLVPIILGLVMPLSGRLKHPKHWYALAIAGALWLIVGGVLLILLATV